MTEDELFEVKLQFAALETTLCVIDQRGFESLANQLKGSSGMRQLLRAISARKELWAFSSEPASQIGTEQIRALPQHVAADFACLPLSLALVLNQAELMGDGVLHVNFGDPTAFDLPSVEVPALKRLALMLRLASHPAIWVLQDARGVAMLKERGGKRYAVGFLTAEDGDILLHKSRTSVPGSALERNKPKVLVQELLHSPIEGLILDYKGDAETTLDRAELGLLLKIINRTVGTSFSLLKKLIPF